MDAAKSEVRDGMQIDWDVPIPIDDGVVLRADVFRPPGGGKFPIVLSYGPYAKGLSFQEGYKGNWARLTKAAPEVLQGSSNKYQNWELVDPEKWVPEGYACVRVDSRGAGSSKRWPRLDFSHRITPFVLEGPYSQQIFNPPRDRRRGTRTDRGWPG